VHVNDDYTLRRPSPIVDDVSPGHTYGSGKKKRKSGKEREKEKGDGSTRTVPT